MSLHPTKTLTLTGNKRLSRYLQIQYDLHQQSQGKTVWEIQKVLPLVSWLELCWQELQIKGLVPAATLLTEHQTRFLWEKIITDSYPTELLNIHQTAAKAAQAFELLQQWKIPLTHSSLLYSDSSLQFQQWAMTFIQQCKSKNLITQNQLFDVIENAIKKTTLVLPKKIILAGFLEFTPQLLSFIDTLKTQGCDITYHSSHDKTGKTYQIGFKNTEDEISKMVNWVKETNQQSPNARIACIIPELNSVRDMLKRVFLALFNENEFNISSGINLSKEPLIDAALLALHFKYRKLSLSDVGYLLRSPFLSASQTEFHTRALLDEKLRLMGNTELTIHQLIHAADQCPKLQEQLKKMASFTYPTRQKPSEWITIFSEILLALNFPGERTINSREYQAIEHWKSCLSELISFDDISPQLTYHDALYQLMKIASHIIFQPKTSETPIQILGLLENIGLEFDYCWVMGLDDLHWPAPANPNPFIPYFLQREYQLPHASAEREFAFSRLMTEQLSQCANTVIFSYPKQENDQLLFPSRLIQNFSEFPFEIPLLNKPKNQIILETILDEYAPPITEKESVSGGTKIFKLQAACPFQAFAKIRLKAQSLQEVSSGFTEIERGIIVHHGLEIFWNQTQTHAALCELSQATLEKTVSHLIDSALYRITLSKNLPKSFYELEKKRMTRLIMQWLAIEKERLPFKVVAKEKWQSVIIGKLSLNMQIDRIDELEDGSRIIIDYKTGLNSISQWLTDRPDEPQLPLYATFNHTNLSGIYFAQIRPKLSDCRFNGISRSETQILRKKTKVFTTEEWNKQLDDWQQTLEKLGDEFAKGNAKVDPKEADKTCQYCDLQGVCRINSS
jgi:ATP-dependent helicase/nuclease subunit B